MEAVGTTGVKLVLMAGAVRSMGGVDGLMDIVGRDVRVGLGLAGVKV